MNGIFICVCVRARARTHAHARIRIQPFNSQLPILGIVIDFIL